MWGLFSSIGGTCGFGTQTKQESMWVRAQPELAQREVPGLDEELLEKMSSPGGSLEEKISCIIDAFRCNARHLESLQTLLRRRAVDKPDESSVSDDLPSEVRIVISEGTYLDDFLPRFDGKQFPLYAEEVVPYHEYRLALEVMTGGAYWSNIAVQDAPPVIQKVETVGACSPVEGSASIIAQYGAAQRGAVFVWRWHYCAERDPYALPSWLNRVLATEGNDPLRKLQSELESIRRWEIQIRQETSKHVKAGKEIKDPYIKEVLRLWPTETDPQGFEQLKKCAWVEGLDSKLFTGRTVPITRVMYDDAHSLALQAVIAKRHTEEAPKENSPPYRLTTTWQWVAVTSTVAPSVPNSAALIPPSSSSVAPAPLPSAKPCSEMSLSLPPRSQRHLDSGDVPGAADPSTPAPVRAQAALQLTHQAAKAIADPGGAAPDGTSFDSVEGGEIDADKKRRV